MANRGEHLRDGRRVARRLRGFDRFARRAERRLAAHHGSELAREVVQAARAEYERLLPHLPFIGGWRNIYTPVITVNGWGIALWRAMKARGLSARDWARIGAEVSDEFLRSIPGFLLRLEGRLFATAPVKLLLRRQAARSQRRRYPEDFVFQTEEGGEDDGALVFEECAVQKLYRAQRVEELAPYCNFFDLTYGRLMNLGVNANETLGLGYPLCRLRYKVGRETQIPPTLHGVLPRT